MGFLTEGRTLNWKEAEQYRKYVKEHGLIQFVNLLNRVKDRKNDDFLWGDEVEYIILNVPEDGSVSLNLDSASIREKADAIIKKEGHDVILHPEYGSFMIEATPGAPYADTTHDLLKVERSMRSRRGVIERCLPKDAKLYSLGCFPMMGTENYLNPKEKPHGKFADSEYISDSVINPHPRFGCLTQNIRMRRGSNVDIRIPIFRDENTDPNVKEIHMDAMAFGMGCCCLQVTFQARNLHEARCLYDQLATLSPIMMALGGSTPFYRGQISDIDCRWTVIAQSVDDRTPAEKGLEELKEGEKLIPKSRYDTIDTYICKCHKRLKSKWNDIDLVIDDSAHEYLVKEGVDDRLARHIAHLWIRDPLVIYEGKVEVDDEKRTDHFENIQSTNWQNVRFKPPPPDSDIGWRVEFRTMEIQLTEFENAAFVTFVALLNRAILYYKLNLYISLKQVDENMRRAHSRDAVNTEKFFCKLPKLPDNDFDPPIEELSLKEIMCGTEKHPGLISIVKSYLDQIGSKGSSRQTLNDYLCFLEKRSTGKIQTTATWMRNFVKDHASYKHDSMLNDEIVKDLLLKIDQITHDTYPLNCPTCKSHPKVSHRKYSDHPIKMRTNSDQILKPLQEVLDEAHTSTDKKQVSS